MRTLVLDGDNRAALAVVRSLGRAGHWVAVGDASTAALAMSSRYCAETVQYPDPATRGDDFITALLAAVESLRIDVLLPMTDVTTIACAKHRHQLSPSCRLPFAPAEAIDAAADKIGVLERANRLGVPTPRTVVAHNRDFVPTPGQLTYPVVLKPGRSRVLTASGWKNCSVSYAASPEVLTTQLAACGDEYFPMALQELIAGPGVGVFLCYANGAPVASFAHRRLREKPPSGGVSVLSESIRMPAAALGYAERLLGDLGWDGVAMIEFKQDNRDGTLRLMEINGRFWGSLQLAVDAGVDFPGILVDSAMGSVPPAPPPYRIGVRSRWLWGDVDSLLIQLFGEKTTSRTIRGGRAAVVLEFLKLWGRDLHYENPRWGDLGPWFNETRKWLVGN